MRGRLLACLKWLSTGSPVYAIFHIWVVVSVHTMGEPWAHEGDEIHCTNVWGVSNIISKWKYHSNNLLYLQQNVLNFLQKGSLLGERQWIICDRKIHFNPSYSLMRLNKWSLFSINNWPSFFLLDRLCGRATATRMACWTLRSSRGTYEPMKRSCHSFSTTWTATMTVSTHFIITDGTNKLKQCFLN